ncbi:MAG: MarR family transcriptional regulator [Candidatus Latescibacteria bacterium]|nr:MarR family transcriptional regulator [Candidatus Latescibacterota bacterium]NIM64425.1 MarR family transcriptional regulator [Candidatus Latescibacterota bacterium]NIO00579.1 MarR family transcriptional regulator [Candidatus Latescibacterota bacterium]NIO26979.1 MarR family transcriptional regulator [Candidatus Latescibacterota bacterium]NIO56056.1 MarR family transcriptional regulator [Candidatus Latescibacterota bacterium]
MPARAMHYDQLILQALRRIIRAVDIHSQKLKSTHQITGPQLICLIAIVEHGPLSIGQIAQHIHLSPSTVVGVLDRLESKGLVLRLRDTKDRRVVNVRATPSGIQIVQKAPSPLHEGLANALKNLPDIEQSTIALALERIVDLMEVRHIEATPILETGQLSSAEEGESGSLPADEPNTKRTHPSSENEGS